MNKRQNDTGERRCLFVPLVPGNVKKPIDTGEVNPAYIVPSLSLRIIFSSPGGSPGRAIVLPPVLAAASGLAKC